MRRLKASPNGRMATSALTALAAVIGITLIAATPAKADHEFREGPRVAFSGGLFFGVPFFAPPIPVPAPVYVQHEVVYPRPYYYGHRHSRHCHHGHGHHKWRRHDRYDDWDRGDWDRGGRWDRHTRY